MATTSPPPPATPSSNAGKPDTGDIRVRFPAEPLTPAAEANPQGNDESHWAISDAYRILRQQIQRYARGEISGQSVLLAGHRGSGKTTAMHLAIQQVRWFAQNKITDPDPTSRARPYLAIPLFVPIHGPDLLSKEKSDDGQALAEHAMSQIRRALHRALAEEIGERFIQQTEDGTPTPEDREAAYGFRIELDKTPGLALLRNYWDRAGRIGTGLLGSFRIGAGGNATQQASQAYKEIVALDTATRALEAERILGEGTAASRLTPKPAESIEDQLRTLHPNRLREAISIATPVLSLVIGAWASHAVVDSAGPALAAVLGLIAGAITYTFLSRTLTTESKDTISSDASAAAQDIFLPILVKRVYDAGFAPIFVVDELDKIDGDLSVLLGRLMRRLKYVVTDRAFFCFLADRAYYEQFREQIRRHDYPIEETYFADRLLIYHHPQHLREHLKQTLKFDDPESASVFGDSLASLILTESNGHVGDLGRVLKAQQKSNGTLRVDSDFWRTPGYRLQIYMQAAIDQVFRDPLVKARLRQEPSFAEWVNDALYYFPKRWALERQFVQYSDAKAGPETGWPSVVEILGRGALGKQFRDQNIELETFAPSISLEPNSGIFIPVVKPSSRTRIAPEDSADSGLSEGTSLDERDAKFLFECMERLAAYLEHPRSLARDMLFEETPSNVADVAIVLTCPSLVTTFHSGQMENGRRTRTYKWEYGQYGDPWVDDRKDARQKWTDDARKPVLRLTPLEDEFSLLFALDKFIQDSSIGTGVNDLINALSTLPTPPDTQSWETIKKVGELPSVPFKDWLGWKDDWTFEKFLEYLPTCPERGSPHTQLDCLKVAFSILRILEDQRATNAISVLTIAKFDNVTVDKAADIWRPRPKEDEILRRVGKDAYERLRQATTLRDQVLILILQSPQPH